MINIDKVIALGFFDGVHLGHGALLRRTMQLAEQKGLQGAAVTFDRSPGKAVGLLTSVPDRVRLMRTCYGVDEVVCLPFDDALRQMPWQTFIEWLAEQYHAAHLVCGYDYHFGYRGAGTPALLSERCREMGIGCDVVPRLELDGVTVSASCLRQLIAAGQTEQAMRFYGHPHILSGTVRHGKHLGTTLGFPTANLLPDSALLLPRHGVYAVRTEVDGASYDGLCNLGPQPTVGGTQTVAEVWLDGYTGDLYGRTITVSFYRYLRPVQTFASLEALRAEIQRNQTQARDYFAANPKG